MNSALIPDFDQLQQAARKLSRVLLDAVPLLAEQGRFPDDQLLHEIREYDRQEKHFRQVLGKLLRESRLPIPGEWHKLSHRELMLQGQTALMVCQARELAEEYRARLRQAQCSHELKSELLGELREFESLLESPPLPITDEMIDFATHHHPLQNRIEQACAIPAPPPVEQKSVVVPETPQVETAISAPTIGQKPQEDALIFTIEDARNRAGERADLEQPAPPETPPETDSVSVIAEEALIEPSVLDEDLIFDDFKSDPAEKRILTASELNQRLDQFQEELLHQNESLRETRETAPPVETFLPADSVFEELESSPEAEPASGRLRGHLPSEIEQQITSVFEKPPVSPVPLPAEPSRYVESLAEVDFSQIQELAQKADGAQNRFDRVSYLSRLIWELIAQGEYQWAYQVSRCLYANVDNDLHIPAPAPWLLQLLILGDQVKFSSGRVSREFQTIAEQHRKEAMQLAEAVDTPEAFLLRASLMRGAITTASSVAADILRTYVIQPNQTQLYNYCSRIASFSSRASGLKLDQYFYRPGAASIESEARSIRSQVTSWKTNVFDKILTYRVAIPLFSRAYWSVQPAAAVALPNVMTLWRTRQILQSHIARLLQPILENRLTQSSLMETELRRLSQSVILSGADTLIVISENDTVRLPGRTIYNHVQQAIEFGSHWLVLAASFPGIESVLVPQEINELRDEIDRRQSAVFQEMKSLEKTHPNHAHRAALTACRRNMDRIHQLFHPTEEPRIGEQDPTCLMNAELLKIPGIPLDDDWNCPVTPGTLEHQILGFLSNGPRSWDQAFEDQLESGSYRSARSLLRLDVWTDARRNELQEALEDSRTLSVESLQQLAQRIRAQIQESKQIEMISSKEASEYSAQIDEVEAHMSGEYRLDQIRGELTHIRQMLDNRRGQELKKIQERLSRLSGFDLNVATHQEAGSTPSVASLPKSSEEETPEEDDWALEV